MAMRKERGFGLYTIYLLCLILILFVFGLKFSWFFYDWLVIDMCPPQFFWVNVSLDCLDFWLDFLVNL